MMGKNPCSDPPSFVWNPQWPCSEFQRVAPLSLTLIDETTRWPGCSEKVIKLWVSSRRAVCTRDKASRQTRVKLYSLDGGLKCMSTI